MDSNPIKTSNQNRTRKTQITNRNKAMTNSNRVRVTATRMRTNSATTVKVIANNLIPTKIQVPNKLKPANKNNKHLKIPTGTMMTSKSSDRSLMKLTKNSNSLIPNNN
jgi:hypothetical protein